MFLFIVYCIFITQQDLNIYYLIVKDTGQVRKRNFNLVHDRFFSSLDSTKIFFHSMSAKAGKLRISTRLNHDCLIFIMIRIWQGLFSQFLCKSVKVFSR